jgi:hypothetical protein
MAQKKSRNKINSRRNSNHASAENPQQLKLFSAFFDLWQTPVR